MNDWEGNERRSAKITLYDVLLEVREVKNNLDHLTKYVEAHVEDDKKAFESIRKDVSWAQKIIFIGLGAWLLVQFFASTGAIRFRNSIFDSHGGGSGAGNNSYASMGSNTSAQREGWLVRTSSPSKV